MSYETILLHVDDQPHCAERARVAANLALSLSAHLIGLYAVDRFPLGGATRTVLETNDAASIDVALTKADPKAQLL